jgi:SAM-dependent methyltransferase
MDHERGQVDTSAAAVYGELFVPARFRPFSEAIAAAAELSAIGDVLDVANGTGANRYGGDIAQEVADALELPLAPATFDLATSQFGLMFLPDPAAGLREMHRVSSRGLVGVSDEIGRCDGYPALQELVRSELGDTRQCRSPLPSRLDPRRFGVGDPASRPGGRLPEPARALSGRGRLCVRHVGARVISWPV